MTDREPEDFGVLLTECEYQEFECDDRDEDGTCLRHRNPQCICPGEDESNYNEDGSND